MASVAEALRRDVQEAHRALGGVEGWPDPRFGGGYDFASPQGRFQRALAEYAATPQGKADLERRRARDEDAARRYANPETRGDASGRDIQAWIRYEVLGRAIRQGATLRAISPEERAHKNGWEHGRAEARQRRREGTVSQRPPPAAAPPLYADMEHLWQEGRRAAFKEAQSQPDGFIDWGDATPPRWYQQVQTLRAKRTGRQPTTPQRGWTPPPECGAPAPYSRTGHCGNRVANDGDRCHAHR